MQTSLTPKHTGKILGWCGLLCKDTRSCHWGAHRLANDVRSRLDEAARHRQQLEGAVRALQRNQKREDADVVEQVCRG